MDGGRDHGYWDAIYGRNVRFMGIKDEVLDAETSGLEPGRALDLGCGQGANAIKLAARGWSVVAVDWSRVALESARRAAQGAGVRVRWVAADIARWSGRMPFDLVTCLYALPDGEERGLVLARAAAALAPGGTLLVTDWDVSMAPRWDCAEGELTTPEEIVSLLGGLRVMKAEVRRLQVLSPESDPLARGDEFANVVVVRARRDQ